MDQAMTAGLFKPPSKGAARSKKPTWSARRTVAFIVVASTLLWASLAVFAMALAMIWRTIQIMVHGQA